MQAGEKLVLSKMRLLPARLTKGWHFRESASSALTSVYTFLFPEDRRTSKGHVRHAAKSEALQGTHLRTWGWTGKDSVYHSNTWREGIDCAKSLKWSLAAWFQDVSLTQSKFARKGISFLWSLAFRQLSLAFRLRLCSRPKCKTRRAWVGNSVCLLKYSNIGYDLFHIHLSHCICFTL